MKEENRKSATSLKEYVSDYAESVGTFRWIAREMMTPESKRWIYKLLVGIFVLILFQCLQPGAAGYVFNGLIQNDARLVIFGFAGFALCLIIQKLAQYSVERSREWVSGLHWMKLEDRVTELFFEKSIAQHVEEGHALSPTTIEKGKTKIFELQRLIVFEGIQTVLLLGISWILLFTINMIAGLMMTAIALIYIVWSIYQNSIISRDFPPIERRWKDLTRRRAERFENIELVKAVKKEMTEMKEMSDIFDDILRKQDRPFWFRMINTNSVRSMLNAVTLASVFGWGIWLAYHGKIAIGLLYPLLSWSSRMSENLWQIGNIEHVINWHLPSIKLMIETLNMEPAIIDAPNAIDIDPRTSHRICFTDVSHSYRSGRSKDDLMPAIAKVSFAIERGMKVAVLGSSGAGKSTLMKKLLRFDDPTMGAIFIDDHDLRQISERSWKKGIGYIPQQAQILDGSIRYNLTYGLSAEEKRDVTDEKLWNLMRLLKIDFGDRLTQGLDTIVGKRGMKLSGGQAQRIMIGAAVIKKPWLLLVDEATSSLDPTTELEVHRGISDVLTGTDMSALVITHRLSTVRHLCDTFIIMKPIEEVEDGHSQVEAIGHSFEELYQISPTFKRLADDQDIRIA